MILSGRQSYPLVASARSPRATQSLQISISGRTPGCLSSLQLGFAALIFDLQSNPSAPKDHYGVNILALVTQKSCKKVADITQGNIQMIFSCGWPCLCAKVVGSFLLCCSFSLVSDDIPSESAKSVPPTTSHFSVILAFPSTLHYEISRLPPFNSYFSFSPGCTTVMIII
jgi:hypothetical protein